ncbi:MAG: tetratricopeptide repeat protein [Planctomycetes bacterium]|nr:tetratricopeptide repeat protein [Planctomycetota bacterium]
MRARLAALIVAPALALAVSGAAARAADDEVILRDGTSIHGEVVEERPDLVRVAVARGLDRVVIDLPRAQVHWVRRLAAADARLQRDAEAALVRGDVAAAVSALRRLVDLRPDDPRARRELGFALLLQGDHAGAAATLERACALDTIDFESHLQLAQALEALGRSDEAIERFRRASRLGPRHVVAWRGLARLLQARGARRDREEALDALARAAREAPDDERLALERAAVLAAPGPDGAPEPGACLARGRPRGARRAPPAAAAATRSLGRLLAASGEPRPAPASAWPPSPRATTPPGGPEAARAEAALYAWLAGGLRAPAPAGLDAGVDDVDLAWAARALDLLLDDLPHPALAPPALLARARVALRAGDLDEAGEWLEHAALAAAADGDAARAILADALLLQGVVVALRRAPAGPLFGPEVAAAKARQAARLLPWLPAAHEALAAALERDGAYEEAAQAFVRARAPASRRRPPARARRPPGASVTGGCDRLPERPQEGVHRRLVEDVLLAHEHEEDLLGRARLLRDDDEHLLDLHAVLDADALLQRDLLAARGDRALLLGLDLQPGAAPAGLLLHGLLHLARHLLGRLPGRDRAGHDHQRERPLVGLLLHALGDDERELHEAAREAHGEHAGVAVGHLRPGEQLGLDLRRDPHRVHDEHVLELPVHDPDAGAHEQDEEAAADEAELEEAAAAPALVRLLLVELRVVAHRPLPRAGSPGGAARQEDSTTRHRVAADGP